MNITHIHQGDNKKQQEEIVANNTGQNLQNINYPNTSYREILGVIAATFMVIAAFAVIICIIYDMSFEAQKPAPPAAPPAYLSSLQAGHKAATKMEKKISLLLVILLFISKHYGINISRKQTISKRR